MVLTVSLSPPMSAISRSLWRWICGRTSRHDQGEGPSRPGRAPRATRSARGWVILCLTMPRRGIELIRTGGPCRATAAATNRSGRRNAHEREDPPQGRALVHHDLPRRVAPAARRRRAWGQCPGAWAAATNRSGRRNAHESEDPPQGRTGLPHLPLVVVPAARRRRAWG